MRISYKTIIIVAVTMVITICAIQAANNAIRGWRLQHQIKSAEIAIQQTSYTVHHLAHECVWESLNALTAARSICEATEGQHPFGEHEKELLEQSRSISGGALVYILNTEGEVIFSSDYFDESQGIMRNLLGESYEFRDYFHNAMKGERLLSCAIGITTKKRGLYYSAPIFPIGTSPKRIIGVAVIKMNLDNIDRILSSRHTQYLLVSPEKVVFSTNIPHMLYRAIYELQASELAQLRMQRNYADHQLAPIPFTLKTPITTFNKTPYITNVAQLFSSEWKLYTLDPVIENYPLSEEHISVIWAAGGVAFTLLVVFFLLLTLNNKRHHAEQQLHHNRKRFETLVHNVPGAVYQSTWNQERTLSYISEHITTLSGYTSDELTAPHAPTLEACILPEDRERVRHAISNALKKGESFSLRYALQHKDGTIRQVFDRGLGIPNPNGVEENIEGILVDVSAQHRLEEQLKHSQKMDSIGQLAGGVAHDFNNMLGGIMGSSELLLRSIPEDDIDRRGIVDLILKTAHRAASLTHKLLAFSRKGKFISTPFDIHPIIEDAIAILMSSINRAIEIQPKLRAAPSTIVGDPPQIQNMLLNLGLNARDAMPMGGKLIIETQNCKLDDWHCQMSAFDITPGEYIEISVIDTGTGIDEPDIERIFDPFFTTKPVGQGTGLGLSAVYGTVRDHHGSITVSSKKGLGTTFIILLPISQDTAMIHRKPCDELQSGSGTVLVVDDDDIIRHTACHMLQELGYTVLVAADGYAGVEMYRKHQDEIDLVLLDLVMPRMCGEECFATIRRINPTCKVVITSGFSAHSGTHQLIEDGAFAFLKKPYTMHQLSTVIHNALHDTPSETAQDS